MKCQHCQKPIKDLSVIKCSAADCKKTFCALCINLSAISVEKRKVWKCPECYPALCTGNRAEAADIGGDSIAKLTEQLCKLTTEFSSVKTKLDDVMESLAFNNNQLSEFMRKCVASEDRIKHLEKRDKELNMLQATVAQLQSDLRAQMQEKLINEIEILGVPESTSENLHHTVLIAARKVGVELEERDLDWVARVGPHRRVGLPEDGARMPRPVVVRLLRRSKRDQFIKAAKSRKNISSTDIGASGTPRAVFFNERLTRENRALFREARIRSKEQGYRFCWLKQGAIYIRKSEGSTALPIRAQKDLDKLLPTHSNLSQEGTT